MLLRWNEQKTTNLKKIFAKSSEVKKKKFLKFSELKFIFWRNLINFIYKINKVKCLISVLWCSFKSLVIFFNLKKIILRNGDLTFYSDVCVFRKKKKKVTKKKSVWIINNFTNELIK